MLSVIHAAVKLMSLPLMPWALVCFQVGPETNRDIMVQRWGIYVFCAPLWDLQNWWVGWLIAVQMINDSTHADEISPAVSNVQNIHSHTRAVVVLDCILLEILRPFKNHSSLGLLAAHWKIKLLTLITYSTLAAELKLPSGTVSCCEKYS